MAPKEIINPEDIFALTKAGRDFENAITANNVDAQDLVEFFINTELQMIKHGDELTKMYQSIGKLSQGINPGDIATDRDLIVTLLTPVVATIRSTRIIAQFRKLLLEGPLRALISDLYFLFSGTKQLSPADRSKIMDQACAHLDECAERAVAAMKISDEAYQEGFLNKTQENWAARGSGRKGKKR